MPNLAIAIRLEVLFQHWIWHVFPGSADIPGAREAYRRSSEFLPALH